MNGGVFFTVWTKKMYSSYLVFLLLRKVSLWKLGQLWILFSDVFTIMTYQGGAWELSFDLQKLRGCYGSLKTGIDLVPLVQRLDFSCCCQKIHLELSLHSMTRKKLKLGEVMKNSTFLGFHFLFLFFVDPAVVLPQEKHKFFLWNIFSPSFPIIWMSFFFISFIPRSRSRTRTITDLSLNLLSDWRLI